MATPEQLEFLKYPLGRFKSPDKITSDDRRQWIKSIETLPASLKRLTESWNNNQWNTPYRPGGWTARQLIFHISDSHMNSLLRFKLGLTEDCPTIKPYDQDAWVNMSDVSQLSPHVSLELIDGIHQRFSNVLNNMSNDDFHRDIFHPELNKKMSLEKMLALYGWHSEHHLAHLKNLSKTQGW